jgi:hypothetical protein
MRIRALTSSLLLTLVAVAADLPLLWVELGPENRGQGLSVPSGGDGTNLPAQVAGGAVRRIAADSLHLYVRIEDPAYAARAPLDLYVAVDVVDDAFNRISVQYDRQSASPDIGTRYTGARQNSVCLGRGGQRRLFFHLPEHRLGHGQNHGADFRLCAAGGLAVRRIEVTAQRPADFADTVGIDPASLAALRTARPVGMELTLGNDATATDAALYEALSVSSVESYVHWAGVEGTAEGAWDWRQWDEQVRILREKGLKWVPFLIAGPAYATPRWFQNGPDSQVFVCLEHGQPSKVQSIFNPALPRQIERFLNAFAARYRDTGVIESVLLGVTGIYGESIYPAGPEGGWTTGLTGDYHNHGGWWAGDALAQAAFRDAMRRQYRRIGRLNEAWGTRFGGFDEVHTFLPKDAPADRAMADFAEWYQRVMTDWSVFWVKATRRAFPETAIYLCTGGDGRPELGADFTAQAQAIARAGAGIRITNEASDYAANFTITREVSSATRLYRTFAGFEPAGHVDAQGVSARLYNATASGARQLHYYSSNILQSNEALARFRESAHFLVPRVPTVDAALYVSRETWAVNPSVISRFYEQARALRDLTDYEMLTRRSVVDGALKPLRLVVLLESEVLDAAAARALARWVRRGGVLVVVSRAGEVIGSRLPDLVDWRAEVLAGGAAAEGLLERALSGDVPPSWALQVGTPADGPWLCGDWHQREYGLEWPDRPGRRKRWSGARPGLWLPVVPGAAYTLTLDAFLAGHSLKGAANTVSVNGIAIGRLDRAGPHTYTFPVSAEVVGGAPLARLELAVATWSPKELGESGDGRHLGVGLSMVGWVRAGAEGVAPGLARLDYVVRPEVFAGCRRRVGHGWTVVLAGLGDRPVELQAALSVLLRRTPELLDGTAPLARVDGLADGRYATLMADGVLWYEAEGSRIHLEPATLTGR